MAQEFDFVNTDAAEIYNTVMEWLMDSVNEPLYPGDERRIYGEALVFVLVNVYHEMNDTAKQRTLQYARGVVLDALGERVGTKRHHSCWYQNHTGRQYIFCHKRNGCHFGRRNFSGCAGSLYHSRQRL